MPSPPQGTINSLYYSINAFLNEKNDAANKKQTINMAMNGLSLVLKNECEYSKGLSNSNKIPTEARSLLL